jgi:hypothetical protein
MKLIVLVLAFAAAALAQQPPATLWYHGSLAVGSVNKGVEVNERWGELDLINTGAHTRSLTVSVRRWSGQLILEQDYTLAGGEKRTVRIDDPNMNVAVANGFNAPSSPDSLRCGVLVEPLTPEISIGLRSMDLRGDKLKITDISHETEGEGGPCCRYTPNTLLAMRTTLNARTLGWEGRIELSNLDGEEHRVVLCESTTYTRCTGISTHITVPAYGVALIPTDEKTLPYMIFNKPERVLVNSYIRVEGTTSTFDVQSGISFGTTVPEKK